jgi:predicted nucleic acid-binding protein
MPAADFFDTNVIIYAFDLSAPQKQSVAKQLVEEALATSSGVTSFQVVQEALNTLGHKFSGQLTGAQLERVLQRMLLPMMQVYPSASLYTEALRIRERYQYSFYDSLVIAAALTAGSKRLLSEDMQHGQVIDGLRIFNPFK